MPSNFRLDFRYGGKRFDDALVGLNALSNDIAVPLTDIAPDVQKVLKDILDSVYDAMKQRHNDNWSPTRRGPGGAKRGRLARRSGDMLESIKRSIKVRTLNSENVIGVIGGNVQARTHEFGAVIRPKTKKFLAIPLPGALDFKGKPIKTKPRDWPNLFVITSRKGNLLLVRKINGRLQPMYLLTKGPVRIKKRLGLQATLDAASPVFENQLLDRLVKKINQSI